MLAQTLGLGPGAFPSSALAAPEAPTAPPVRRHAAPQPANPYVTTPSARNGNGGGGPAGGGRRGARGVAGGGTAAAALVQIQRQFPHESPAGIAPIAVTVSRARQAGSNLAGRSSSSAAGVAPGTSAAEAGGNVGRENGASSTGRSASTGGATRAVGHGWSGRVEEKWSGGVGAGPATPSATPRTGERGGRLVDGGGTGAFSGDVSTGFGSGGGEEGGGAEDVEEVAKKLDFHTVFD